VRNQNSDEKSIKHSIKKRGQKDMRCALLPGPKLHRGKHRKIKTAEQQAWAPDRRDCINQITQIIKHN
jgi:hypothetical protein